MYGRNFIVAFALALAFLYIVYLRDFHDQPNALGFSNLYETTSSSKPNNVVTKTETLYVMTTHISTEIHNTINQTTSITTTATVTTTFVITEGSGTPQTTVVFTTLPSQGNVKPFGHTHSNPNQNSLANPDYFHDFKGREECNFDWQHIYQEPEIMGQEICKTKKDVLEAMSWGGTIGENYPYIPYGCSHKMYNSTGLCNVWKNFRSILVVGDSLSRNHHEAMILLMRKDFEYGSMKGYELSDEELVSCRCEGQFLKGCGITHAVHSYPDLVDGIKLRNGHSENNVLQPELNWSCQDTDIPFLMYYGNEFGPEKDELLGQLRFELEKDSTDPRPAAVVIQHGTWSGYNKKISQEWTEWYLEPVFKAWKHQRIKSPILWLPPSKAANPRHWTDEDGVYGSEQFQLEMGRYADEVWGIDHINTWNLTLQQLSYDGTHFDLFVNLIRSIFVTNWLDYTVQEWTMSPFDATCNDLRNCSL